MRLLITAGARGIGAAIAEKFRMQGWQIHIVDIDQDALAAAAAEHTLCSLADAADEQHVRRVVKKQAEHFGSLDVMVNCAGIAGPTAPVESVDSRQWHRCIDVNLHATFYFCKHVIPLMRAQGSGSIINISSTAGWHGYPLRTPYAAAKWAIIGFTKSIAMELGPAGIRANVICPGSINGDRMDRVIAAEAHSKGISEQEVRDAYTQSCSLRTFIEAQDIADMAVFLASDAASKVTGQVLNVDGHLESAGAMQ